MTDRNRNSDSRFKPAKLNINFASLQIAKALTTSEEHEDPATRERAKKRVSKWETVFRNILTGAVEYGTRTPVSHVPVWATLEVITGGFATGNLLAGGPLLEHERELLKGINIDSGTEKRLPLNAYFCTDQGLAELTKLLQKGCYDISVPEEGALLVVAWLIDNGYVERARTLLDELSPYFSRLRFFPKPLERSKQYGSRIFLQDVNSTINALNNLRPNGQLLAQKRAVEVWVPLHDRVMALFMETIKNDWPCQTYPKGWAERALAILGEYSVLKKEHGSGGKYDRKNGHAAQLRHLLNKAARKPRKLTGREVGKIRFIIKKYIEKRGIPGSATCLGIRHQQKQDVSAPDHISIAKVVISRLEQHPPDGGLEDISHIIQAITKEESLSSDISSGTVIPSSIQRKVKRSLKETIDVLVRNGLITSGETVARVLPQLTSDIRAFGISEPLLRQLYAAIYRSFRQRRSLLLLNLEKQVQIEELPWVDAIEHFRKEDVSSRELARQTLEEITAMTLTCFPQTIIPNKLLKELRTLASSADLNIPLVDELAADIFMGDFSGKFVEAAKLAADLLSGTLYETYYDIDYSDIDKIPENSIKKDSGKGLLKRKTRTLQKTFIQLCEMRAGVSAGSWDPATNGMLIEQQQILTTQNLASLFIVLDLRDQVKEQLEDMAKQCFRWICRRQQMKTENWHARLIVLKNTAYAWRQMVFFLALLPNETVTEFLTWAQDHLNKQKEDFTNRFQPALNGLIHAAKGHPLDGEEGRLTNATRFVGWSKKRHWLLTEDQN